MKGNELAKHSIDRDGDWGWAQVQYESTDTPVPDIAKVINRSATYFYQHAVLQGWERNKRARLLDDAVLAEAAERSRALDEYRIKQESIERVNIEMQARVLTEHRSDISRARKIVMRLFTELEALMDNEPELESIGEILRNPNERGQDKLNDVYRKVISFPDRTDAVKKLGDSLKTLILLQRQAFGIQGAIEDPEKAIAGDPDRAAASMNLVLQKFASVLEKATAKDTELVPPKNMGEVIENPS